MKSKLPTARVVRIGLTGARIANDDIPKDEMLLAEAIAAARARGLGWTTGAVFADGAHGLAVPLRSATHCCAIGGLILAGRATKKPGTGYAKEPRFAAVHYGNDGDFSWEDDEADRGESLGWAFRCAMEEP